MIEERILDAVERIDGAMSRIEAAARRPAPAPAPRIDGDASLEALIDLRERHATMRGRVQAAIAELDTLITSGPMSDRPSNGRLSNREMANGDAGRG